MASGKPTASLYDARIAAMSCQELDPAARETLLTVVYYANDMRTAYRLMNAVERPADVDVDALWLRSAQTLSKALAELPDNQRLA